MPRRRSEAERRLAELDQTVDDARARLSECHHAQRELAAQHDRLEAQVRDKLYTAAASGSKADVSTDRDAAAKLAQELADTGPVEAALADGIKAAEQRRAEYIVQHYPELADALTQRAQAVLIAGEELAAQHAREANAQAAAEREIADEWQRIQLVLPAPFRGRVRADTLTIDPDPFTPTSGLAVYVDDGSWAPWMTQLHAASQQLAQQERDSRAIGVPMAG